MNVLEEATLSYEWKDKTDANTSVPLYMSGTETDTVEELFGAFEKDPLLKDLPTLRSVAGVHVPVEVYQGCECCYVTPISLLYFNPLLPVFVLLSHRNSIV